MQAATDSIALEGSGAFLSGLPSKPKAATDPCRLMHLRQASWGGAPPYGLEWGSS